MGGGLMQLVAYGAQDVYLTTDPEITFFRAVYRKHTNFAIESIDQVFNGTAEFGRKVTATISRNGDLVTNMYLQVELPETSSSTQEYVNNFGHALIKEVELEIGGQRIDRQYGEWLDIWTDLTMTGRKKEAYDSHMVMRSGDSLSLSSGSKKHILYIPLQFFFNRNPGLALPLIALQYHEVKINITFNDVGQLVLDGGSGAPVADSTPKINLYVDYVYLDTDERKRFAQSAHEMLIEQVQFTGDEDTSGKYRLNFNHPVKELIWVVNKPLVKDPLNYYEFLDENTPYTKDIVKDVTLQLNGHDRFVTRPGSYFRLVQPFQHHTSIPDKRIYVYSFAIKPEDHQPSGTCNFSRIDNASLNMNFESDIDATNTKVKIFALSVNVLRIMSGMGGLAYSN